MIQIKKLRADHVIDFAAEELKRYLRMMEDRSVICFVAAASS